MGFNYGLEKKNFDRQWAIMRKQYEDAGMSSEAILVCFQCCAFLPEPHAGDHRSVL